MPLKITPESMPNLISRTFPTEYQPLRLMQLSISKTNDVCQSLLDNLQLDAMIPSPPIEAHRPPLYSARGIKNTRRHMEDRHIIIDDFNTLFRIKVTWTTLPPPARFSIDNWFFWLIPWRTGYGPNELLCDIRWTRWNGSGRIQCLAFALRNRLQQLLSKLTCQSTTRGFPQDWREVHR